MKVFTQIKSGKWNKHQRWDKWCDIQRVNPKVAKRQKIKKSYIPIEEFREQQIYNRNVSELKAKSILDQLEIRYEYQKIYGPYVLDFYLPDYRIDLEMDGFHHKFKRKSDKRRSQWLRKRNVTTVRFWNSALKDESDFKELLLEKLSLCTPTYLLNKQMDEEYFHVCQ